MRYGEKERIMKDTIHLLISRVGLYWRHPNLKVSWEDYILQRVMLYNTITKPSIIAQSDQDFELVSLVDSDVFLTDPYYEDYILPNERVLKVQRYSGGGYPKRNIVQRVQDLVHDYSLLGYKYVIVSRVDSDDLLHKDFIKEVKECLPEEITNFYVDMAESFTYDLNTGKAYQSHKYDNIVSPFVSVRENIEGFGCLPYAVEHSQVPEVIKGFKTNRIKAVQVIHENNMINKHRGNEIKDFPFNEYGSFFS